VEADSVYIIAMNIHRVYIIAMKVHSMFRAYRGSMSEEGM